MKILLLNDIHHGKTRESSSHPGLVRQASSRSLPKLEDLVSKLSEEKFDLVLQLGDLVKETGDLQSDRQLFSDTLRVLGSLPFPISHVLGNHDLGAFPLNELVEIFSEAGHAPDFFGVEQYPDLQVVRLDMETNSENHALLADERLHFLQSNLLPDKPTLIFSHYPLTLFEGKGSFYFDKPGSMQWMKYTNNEQVLDVLTQFNILAFVSAHVHFAGCRYYRGHHFISLPAFVENIAAEDYADNNPAVYSLLEIKDGRLSLQSCSGKFAFFNVEV